MITEQEIRNLVEEARHTEKLARSKDKTSIRLLPEYEESLEERIKELVAKLG